MVPLEPGFHFNPDDSMFESAVRNAPAGIAGPSFDAPRFRSRSDVPGWVKRSDPPQRCRLHGGEFAFFLGLEAELSARRRNVVALLPAQGH
jgi:hypothetical protein